MKKNKQSFITNICISGMMAALYIVMEIFLKEISLVLFVKSYELPLSALPIMLAAVLAGPLYGAGAGLVGELICQAVSEYGIGVTTPLWVLPVATRGLLMGLILLAFKSNTKPLPLVVASAVSSVAATVLNTLALLIDSKINGYYSYTLVFGSALPRMLISLIFSVALIVVSIPVIQVVVKNTPIKRYNR